MLGLARSLALEVAGENIAIGKPTDNNVRRGKAKFFVQFALTPPGRIPTERNVLVDRHQLAAVEDG